MSIGIAFIVLSSVILAPLSQTATKYLTADFPLMQIVWVRSAAHILWMVALFWPQQRLRVFRTSNLKLQLARSSLLFLSSLCWITAISTVPLTTASSIGFTAPIMVVLLSIPLLGERVGMYRWMAVLVGFGGALIIIRPGVEPVPPEVFLLLAAAFLFAVFQIITRKLASMDSAATTSVYTVFVALIASTLVLPWNFEPIDPSNWLVLLAFFATGLIGGFRHFFVVKAYEHAPASVISPFFYCELVGVTILGFLVFGDFPDSHTWLGAAIIVSSGLYIAHRERVRAKQPA